MTVPSTSDVQHSSQAMKGFGRGDDQAWLGALQAVVGGELDAGDGLAAAMAGTTPADLYDPAKT